MPIVVGGTGRAARSASLTVVALLAALLAPTGSASAVPPSEPTSLSVQQPDDSTNILSWAPVAQATKYEVQVDDDPSFGSTYLSISTVNTSFVPPMNLTEGTNYWRVRALTGNEASTWVSSEFGKAAVARPTTVSPANGSTLAQPTNPPLLSWTAVPGATGYKIEVDDAEDFVNAMTFETKTTSLVVDQPLNAAPWYWRVSALKGPTMQSLASDVATFTILALPAPTRTSPPDDANLELQDVVLDWNPVAGAKSYDIQVSTSEDFTQGGSLIETRTGIVGTRYSPLTTYDNNQYFWRVRAVDLDNRATAWSPARSSFNRTWPDVPTLVYPAAPGTETLGEPLYFQWQSVRHASEYEIQIGTQANFTVGTFESCRVAGTTYVAGQFAINTTGQPTTNRSNEDCDPKQGTVNYWRVRALDRPFTKSGDIPGVQGIFSETQAFLYQPLAITGLSPVPGQTVSVPTLSWVTLTGAELYDVEVRTASNDLIASTTTRSTSWTLPGDLKLDPADNPHIWRVSATSAKGADSVTYQSTFNIGGTPPTTAAEPLTPLTPTPTSTGIRNAPQLTWEPMPGADHYSVDVGNAMDGNQIWFGGTSTNLFRKSLPYPAMTDISGQLLLPGKYDWQVTAYNANNVAIAVGPESRFTVEDVALTTGHRVALNGSAVAPGSPANACDPNQVCTVPSTPILKWTPDPDAAYYMVYVSEDASFTNLLEQSNRIPATTSTMYAPTLDNTAHTYADSQAGGAYYWYARPCRSTLNCGPDPVSTIGQAQQSFVKRSPQVTGLQTSSAAGTEITFSWADYFDTNRSASWPQTGEQRPQTAKQYRIQVNNVESFAGTLVDERLVDQPTYTAFDKLYPEGPLFWRVQAVDSDDNGLAWSDIQSFTKSSPQVSLQSPVGNNVVAGTTPFRWTPQAFASSYDLEVYKNDDATFSTANRVISKSALKTAAYAHTDPLPAASSAYRWRVRRTDAKGNKGPWSASGRFTVSSGVMSILSPTPGGSQPPTGPVLQWAPLDDARNYTVAITPLSAGGTSVSAQSTVASAYAAQVNFVTGSYQWTVTARDAANNVIGSATSTFTVDNQLKVVQAPQIQALGGTGVGQAITSVAPSWSQPDVTNTYQWLRDGVKISGATTDTYVLTAADFGKAISLQVTGAKPGFSNGVAISNVIGATAGGALQATVAPSVTGTTTVGQTLRVSSGTWSQPSPSFKYQWLRTGAPIPGATSSSYRLTAEDAGRDIAAVVTATKAGFADGAATSSALSIGRMASTVTGSLKANRIKASKKAKLGITLTVAGLTGPNGTIQVLDKGKKIASFTMAPVHNGKKTIKLKKLKKGKHKLTVVYLGTAQVFGSKSKPIVLYVTK